MTPRTRAMTRAEVQVRAQHAHSFIQAADLVDQLGEEAGIPQIGNTIASLAVLAGIAASDAMCGAILGTRAAGEGHSEAVDLLRSTEPGKRLAAHLRRLIDAKTEVQYSAAVLTRSRASDLMKAAQRLIAGMDEVLRQA